MELGNVMHEILLVTILETRMPKKEKKRDRGGVEENGDTGKVQ